MADIRLRLYPPTRSITGESEDLRLRAICEGYLLDELAIKDGERDERPTKAVVIFDQSQQQVSSRIEYASRWLDPETGSIFSGTLRLYLPLSGVVESYLRNHDFSEHYVILEVVIAGTADGKIAIHHIGPDDEGEFHWDSGIAMQLPASIRYLAPDHEPRPESAEKPQDPKPLRWQADAIQAQSAALQAQQSTINELRKEARSIRLLLTTIAFGLLIYAFTKAI